MNLPKTSITQKTMHLLPLAFALCWALSSVDADAQQWQYVYGGDNTYETGARGVIPVTSACRSYPSCQSCTTQSNGFIAVGTTSTQESSGGDVYVVRTANNGSAIWEASYDISGFGSNDWGSSIVQLSDGSGFAITGHTTTSNNTEVFILKIDCDGAVVWSRTYRGPQYSGSLTEAQGNDITEATTGNSSYGTGAGDLIVAGYVRTTETYDGLLLRTSSTGNLIWNAAYDEPNSSIEYFHALIEATPVSPEPAGDIIAAGMWNARQGYVVRANGNTGAISTALQGSAMYGNPASYLDDHFLSVVELQNPNETGTNGQPNVVLTGWGKHSNGVQDIFLVKLDDGDPCSPLAQTLVGNTAIPSPAQESANDIQEIPFALTGSTNLAQWDLVITGSTNWESTGVTGDFEAFLLGIDPGTLRPVANTGRIYHPTGTSDDQEGGHSLAIVGTSGGATQGVIMCGLTRSDWRGVSDPKDMYLLKTNTALSTGLNCEGNYNPGYVSVSGSDCGNANYASVLRSYAAQTNETARDWGDVVCTNSGNSGKAVPGFASHETRATEAQTAYLTSILGNPVRAGEELRIAFDGDELPEAVKISISNSAGEQILAATDINVEAGIITLATHNWPTGTCFITINDRGYRRMLRAVILD